MRYLKLNVSTPAMYVDGVTQGYRVLVSVAEVVDMPAELFVYQRKPIYGIEPYTDVFSHLASPADLEEYPVGAPDNTKEPFFRLSTVDFVFRSLCLANDARKVLKAELDLLIESLDYMDALIVDEVMEFGTAPASSSSSN